MRRIAQGKPVPEAKTDKVEDSADKVEETATEITTSLSNVEDEPKPKKSQSENGMWASQEYFFLQDQKNQKVGQILEIEGMRSLLPSFYYANDRVDNSKANSQITSEQLTRVMQQVPMTIMMRSRFTLLV
ncbi:hypothetical protein EB796_005109 [Bugula neritina]|uniref:Uncharacterized protein n=1 Tax=Bugula neritina TaxID=10212 RepID=A0A7J7KEC4_BUGNE|nr:hypothetical protein EB796_005109 [Bugula neritina]